MAKASKLLNLLAFFLVAGSATSFYLLLCGAA
jgi:hypothetical protein